MYKARGWKNMTNHSIAVDAIAHVLLFEMSVSLCSNILDRFHVMSAWRRDRKVSSDPDLRGSVV